MELKETYYDEDEIEIDLLELFYMMKRKLIFIILFFLIGSGIAFSVTYFGIKPTYQSTAKIYVVSASKNSVLDLTGLNMGSSLAADYEQLILSDTVLNNVIKKLDLDMDAKDLAGKIELNNPADTRILEITVTTTDAVLSKDIANKVVDVSLKYLPKTMSANPPNIAQRAKLMPEKTGPGYVKNTLIGGIAAVFLYCAYLVIRFLMDDTIKTPEDMEKYFGMLPLTTIPEGKKGKMMKQLEINIPKLPYALEEAMNRLRVNIKFCGDQTRKLMVTSSVPNEGKSFVSVHLWEMLAQMGMPSVLVDIDLRKSVIEEDYHYIYSGELKGLDHYLSGISEEEEIIYHTNIENGDIIPVANHLENPSTLLEDPRMKKLLESLAEKYRYVILDTPPLQSVSDGNLVTALSDGVILVVRGESTSKKLIRNSLHQIESCNGRLLGMVLNRVKINQHAYYKYYGEYGEYK